MGESTQTLTIALAAGIPGALIIIVAALLVYRSQRRKARLFRRGITPIGDEEIQSWKGEKSSLDLRRPSYHTVRSVCSIQKPAGVIVYTPHQYTRRPSEDRSTSSRSFESRRSGETSPLSQARAPNSRPGLTDETVQGDEAYVTSPQSRRIPSQRSPRHPPPPVSSTNGARRNRAWSTRSMQRPEVHDQWFAAEMPNRRSADTFKRTRSMHTTASQGRLSSAGPSTRVSLSEDMMPTGLSPPPRLHQSEIGVAIG